MGPDNRPLDLDWLEDFLALAASGSFSKAAHARAIAQPALSRHIRALEEWVGVPLFDRSAHPAQLTLAGQSLQPDIEELLDKLIRARAQARAATQRESSNLVFAATHALSLNFFPAWLNGLEAQLRIGAIQMSSDHFHACEEAMLQRKVQFFLCHGHGEVRTQLDELKFPFQSLALDTLVPVSARQKGKRGPRYRLDQTDASEPTSLLNYSNESGLGRILRTRLGKAIETSAFTSTFTAHHAVLLKTLALEGRGIAWLPRRLIEEELSDKRLVEAGGANWHVPLEIRLYRQSSELPAVAESLWRTVGQQQSA
jgi:LysR family transcriptional regulator, hypochlorite-specific transcription factor HypT